MCCISQKIKVYSDALMKPSTDKLILSPSPQEHASLIMLVSSILDKSVLKQHIKTK